MRSWPRANYKCYTSLHTVIASYRQIIVPNNTDVSGRAIVRGHSGMRFCEKSARSARFSSRLLIPTFFFLANQKFKRFSTLKHRADVDGTGTNEVIRNLSGECHGDCTVFHGQRDFQSRISRDEGTFTHLAASERKEKGT